MPRIGREGDRLDRTVLGAARAADALLGHPVLDQRRAPARGARAVHVGVILVAARWTVQRLSVPAQPSLRLGMGLLALSLLLLAELSLVLGLRGLTLEVYLATRDPVAGTVYYLMLGVFALMPLFVGRR